MISQKLSLLIVLILLFGHSFINCKNEKRHALNERLNISIENSPKKQHNVTIWVHGTRGSAFLPLGITKTIKRIERKACEAPRGLHKASIISDFYYQKFIAKTISESDQEDFPFEHFYIFGWSGDLLHSARMNAGMQLYHEICILIKEYYILYGEKPKITILTHSHGGNVVMGAGLFGKQHNPSFTVDRFICLACPVQQETAHSLDTGAFSKVYSFYSSKDYLQVLDPQKVPLMWNIFKSIIFLKPWNELKKQFATMRKTPLFSSRVFNPLRPIIQIAIYWKDPFLWTEQDLFLYESYAPWVKKTLGSLHSQPGRELFHIEFIHYSFLIKLPEIIKQADANSDIGLIKI